MKDGAVYEDLTDFKALKKFMEDQLEDYSMEPGVIPMDLVLFRDAIEHGIYIIIYLDYFLLSIKFSARFGVADML